MCSGHQAKRLATAHGRDGGETRQALHLVFSVGSANAAKSANRAKSAGCDPGCVGSRFLLNCLRTVRIVRTVRVVVCLGWADFRTSHTSHSSQGLHIKGREEQSEQHSHSSQCSLHWLGWQAVLRCLCCLAGPVAQGCKPLRAYRPCRWVLVGSFAE